MKLRDILIYAVIAFLFGYTVQDYKKKFSENEKYVDCIQECLIYLPNNVTPKGFGKDEFERMVMMGQCKNFCQPNITRIVGKSW
jgi:hypothetical protein